MLRVGEKTSESLSLINALFSLIYQQGIDINCKDKTTFRILRIRGTKSSQHGISIGKDKKTIIKSYLSNRCYMYTILKSFRFYYF